MSKHINLLLKIVEIIVSRGFAETEEGGHDLGLIWYYQGIMQYNGTEYRVRYYTGKYNGEVPTVELYTDEEIAYTFNSSEKCPISISMHRAFDETFQSKTDQEQ
ncbi:hypothetical protein VPDG_00055 [Vibrio phage henriette 12B8]|uniref:hypothetical protein n=1 Tax=Vibrio phage henriette 12B8 TaxID=573174 RepID=UPI0002C0C3D1|nr:hypothetical protein VPDG_00055 [Vibrio phage henriette 12B8]AGG58216.1 hypothetical protein VPDG_00055 [Vibrio phage henriette 12B8]